MKILIYNSGGGLGDSIQLFDLILSLSKKFGEESIYYLSAHNNHFDNALKGYNIVLNNVNSGISFFGFRLWHLFTSKQKILKKNLIDKFDLIIDLQSKLRNTIILKQFSHKNFYSSSMNFKFCNIQADYKTTKYDNKIMISNLEKMLNLEIPFKRYNIDSINKSYFDEAKKLLPKSNYIGFSITQGNEYRKKSWSIYKFTALANKVTTKNKIPVFFIEKNQEHIIEKIKNQVPGSLFPEINSELSCPALVTALSSRLDQAVSIDNGVMHMMGLSGIPMIVLFGPTNSKKFKSNQKNIKILDSKEMYGVKDVSKIKLDDVLNFL